MSEIDYQALRDAAVAVETEPMHQNFVAFRMAFTPSVALHYWMNGKETSNTSNAVTRRTRILLLRLGS